MVGKTEFKAPLHVLHQCPTSQPKHSVLQYLQALHLSGTRLLSELTFKPAHLQSDTWSLCATLTLSVHLLQNPHLLLLSWTASNGAVPIFFLSYFTVCTKFHQHQNCTSKGEILSGQKMLSRQKIHGWPSFSSTKQAPHTGPPQQHGRREAKSFTTGILTRELDRGKFLSGFILPISQDFKSTMWPILSQLTYGEICTKSNSRNQKLLSGFAIAEPDMWVRFHSTELVISTVLLN